MNAQACEDTACSECKQIFLKPQRHTCCALHDVLLVEMGQRCYDLDAGAHISGKAVHLLLEDNLKLCFSAPNAELFGVHSKQLLRQERLAVALATLAALFGWSKKYHPFLTVTSVKGILYTLD